MDDERFSFRWGVAWLDAGFVQVPNCFFKHYFELGISGSEFLFILHLAVFKFESPRGYACPSLATIAKEMGMSRRGVGKLRESLETSGWLTVRRRVGETSMYDFQAFSLAMMRLEEVVLRSRLPGAGERYGTPVPGGYGTPVPEGDGTPVPEGMEPQFQGDGTPVLPKNKQETEKKPQQQPVAVVPLPTARERERAGQEVVEPPGPGGRQEADRGAMGGTRPADQGGQEGERHAWELNGDLQDLGFGQEQGARLLQKYGLERVREVVAAVAAQKGEIRDSAAWVVTALKQGYTFSRPREASGQAEEADRERMRCAWVRNSGLGVCPSREANLPLFAWCEQCEKLGGG